MVGSPMLPMSFPRLPPNVQPGFDWTTCGPRSWPGELAKFVFVSQMAMWYLRITYKHMFEAH